MAKTSMQIFKLLQKKLKRLEQIRNKQESLFVSNQIALRDVEEVYGALFLNTVASFEGFVEDLFMGLLAGKIGTTHSNINVRVKIQSYMVARDVFLRERKYFKWLPYENTIEAAKSFFTGGRPFSNVSQSEESLLDRCVTIRNAIAHQSRHAVNAYKQHVLAKLTLAPREKRPKAFLRAQFAGVPSINYYEHYIAEILKIANKLC